MKICVDPGHGGRDPGAIGPKGTREADITLAAAHHLGAALSFYDHQIIMTRTTPQALSPDKKEDLWLRANKANQQRCDLFISLHCNSFSDPSVGGSETWYYKGSTAGEKYARVVQQALHASGGLQNRGIKHSTSLAVLRLTAMPAMLVEMAFISNLNEEQLLRDHQWLTSMMKAIAVAVQE